jgi:signal transduction histidine kinase
MRIRVRSVLTAGLGIIVGLFALATLVTIGSVSRVGRLEESLTHFDHAKHEGHLTLSAVQRAFMHQSQIISLGDPTHLDLYDEARQAALEQLKRLEDASEAVGVTEGPDEIRQTFNELQRYFEEEVLPDLGTSGPGHVDFHDHLAALTERAGALNHELNSILEGRSAEARDELKNVLRLTQAATVTMLSLSILAASIVGVVLVRLIARPVADLHRALEAIGGGDLNVRVSATGPEELVDLAQGLNDMVAALQESRDLVAQQERRAAIGELAAGIAHELNNPLGVIKGYIKVLRKEVEGSQSGKDLDIITDEVNQCQRIVQGLLELARPQTLEMQPIELVEVVREALERLEKARTTRGPKITISTRPERIEATADSQAVKRILVNLINNATDAAGPGGEVDVTVEEADGSAVISVGDSGKGIPPEIRDNLFKPFQTTKPDGTGLGLAISDALVRAHGGRIEADSGPKGGALFRVIIPGRERNGNGA